MFIISRGKGDNIGREKGGGGREFLQRKKNILKNSIFIIDGINYMQKSWHLFIQIV